MDAITKSVVALDLENLTPDQIKFLHDLKAQAFKDSLAADFAKMKGETR